MYMHRLQRYKKLLDHTKVGLAEELFRLQLFSYTQLEDATHGFKEKLGRGIFGAVYKGTLSTSNKMVAVKRLEKVVEEEVREFKAEITTIGRTHHRNLLQLLGFCIEGSRKLLVYQYISNGSLAHLLFNKATTVRPSWRERVGIVLDVAKGVLYLHEECGVHIIHCNLKPHNILLDHSWTAKSEEVDKKTLENMVTVGLWCIQDEPALRPSMKSVVLMLQGITDIAIPPCPTAISM